jgi:hypothetical protein
VELQGIRKTHLGTLFEQGLETKIRKVGLEEVFQFIRKLLEISMLQGWW